MASDGLTFDDAEHRYTLDGREVPSVTGILAPLYDFGGIPAAALEAARWRGTLVHEAIHQDNTGVLDIEALHPILLPYLMAWREWQAHAGAVIIASEHQVASRKYGYAGTLDAVADIRGKRILVDVKATAELPKPVGPQTAAYAQAWQETTGTRIEGRMVVRVDSRDTKTQSRRLTDPADWAVFQSCLNIHRWKDNNR
jgi:hypothetical protein